MSKTLVPISRIVPNPDQPRKYFAKDKMASLVKSIKRNGIVNPILVEKDGEKFTIIDGERRFRSAVELGIREIPVNITDAKDSIDRLIEQFHVQETHEGWTPMEKADAINVITQEMKKPFKEVCEILGIHHRTAERYFTLTKMASKNDFIEAGIGIEFTEPIMAVINKVKKIKKDDLEEKFLLSDQKKLEKRIIQELSDGTITKPNEVRNLVDIFKAQPKSIEKYLEGAESQELYLRSSARAAHNLRCAVNGANFMQKGIYAFIEKPDVKVTDEEVAVLKRGRDALGKLIALAGKE